MPSVLITPTPAPAPVSVPPRTVAPRPRRRFRRLLRWVMLLLVLAVASLFVPAVFQVALRALLKVEAWQHHSQVEIAQVAGSLFEPVRFEHTQWTFTSRAGSVARVAIDEAEAEFDWRALLPWKGGRWFQRLNL